MEYHTAVKISKLKLTGNKTVQIFLEIYKESKGMMNVELNNWHKLEELGI